MEKDASRTDAIENCLATAQRAEEQLIIMKRKGAAAGVKEKLLGPQPAQGNFGSAFMPDEDKSSPWKDELESFESKMLDRIQDLEYKIR